MDNIEEQLSGACTIEIAAFDEFAKLLGDQAATSDYDHIIFDTAPTGHTLRLLQLPAAWTDFIETNMTGTSCLGPLAGLQTLKELYAKALHALSDLNTTTVFLVSRPDHSALAEADRTRGELEGLSITNQRLILNGVFEASGREDAVALALESRGKKALAEMPQGLRALPKDEVALVSNALIGVEALRQLSSGRAPFQQGTLGVPRRAVLPQPLAQLLAEIAASRKSVVMTMGKGGVGKTTVAAAIAVELARMGHKVHLTTTDPAAHVAMTLNGKVPGLQVTRIDPVAVTRGYTKKSWPNLAVTLMKKARLC